MQLTKFHDTFEHENPPTTHYIGFSFAYLSSNPNEVGTDGKRAQYVGTVIFDEHGGVSMTRFDNMGLNDFAQLRDHLTNLEQQHAEKFPVGG